MWRTHGRRSYVRRLRRSAEHGNTGTRCLEAPGGCGNNLMTAVSQVGAVVAMSELDGRVVLVTGGGRGIGLAAATILAGRGATVLIGARDPRRAERVLAQSDPPADSVDVVHLDVTDPATAADAADWIAKRHGRLDVLVNNAGVAGDRDAQVAGRVDLAVVRAVFDTNVFGVITVTEAMLPMLRRSKHGRVVNVSSSVGSLTRMSDPDHYFAAIPGSVAYPPSKAALNQVTVQYAKQLRDEGILVNAADPGPCATDFTAGLPGVTRTAADGAAVIVELATLDDDGPTGIYRRTGEVVPW